MTLETENLPADLRGESINVILIDMDPGIQEQVNLNPDGSYSIFLNSRLSFDAQRRGFLHAGGHIVRRDWEKSDVQEIEREAHALRFWH